uniref:Glutamate/leucine/phenylalanine/valine dehydrogenase n=1 Tax=Jahnella sp. MSr9139 TaxID=1434086 RepID=A0A3S7UW23_9BACT|nr:glutamate/leucine/phenylalanine/valine dehydrogenase [Jahnella sp. MSr9139]
MRLFDSLHALGHEQVLFCHDPAAGYRAIIAIHSTALGPAVGGTRLWRYADEAEALTDALRLARGMTYKNALAGLPAGGGKSVILRGDGPLGPQDRERLFRAHGRFIERLAGRYFTGEDVGTAPADMEFVARETRHVRGLAHGSSDPSPFTARGVFRAMQAAALRRWGKADLAGRVVALQGCGHVGQPLARLLHEAGARLRVADVDPERAADLQRAHGAEVLPPDAILRADADVLAPCALGGVLNDQTLPEIRAAIVVGAANNQLLEPRHGDALEARGVLYVPDYVANAGGVLSGGVDLFGWTPAEVARRVDAIHDTVLAVLDGARAEGVSSAVAADRLAERRLHAAR